MNKNGRPKKPESEVYAQETTQRLLNELWKYGGSADRLTLFKSLRDQGAVAPAYDLKRCIEFRWVVLDDADFVHLTQKAKDLHEESIEEPAGIDLF